MGGSRYATAAGARWAYGIRNAAGSALYWKFKFDRAGFRYMGNTAVVDDTRIYKYGVDGSRCNRYLRVGIGIGSYAVEQVKTL